MKEILGKKIYKIPAKPSKEKRRIFIRDTSGMVEMFEGLLS